MYKHKIKINKNSLLYKIIRKEEIITNSIHSGKLIETGEYDIAAVSEDGLTEAIEYKNKKFNLGIQWHPELMYKFDKDQEKIFQYFINNL
jgi:putative glutamine amidotransferase